MTDASSGEHLWIIGTGRMGLALGSLLGPSGIAASITWSGRRPIPPDHPLFRQADLRVRYQPDLTPPSPAPAGILLAVPDDSIGEVARGLADAGAPPTARVLHLSGSLGLDALEPLARLGCSVGSMHPLAAIPAGVDGHQRLRGAWFGVEGEGGAREFAEHIVATASGHILPIGTGGKPLYHAAAVFASNYLVVLLGLAERLMEQAGAPAGDAREALSELARGAVANVMDLGPASALTGPASRGDAATVGLHLSRLSGEERVVYSLLGRQALALARERGIDPDAAERIDRVLRGET